MNPGGDHERIVIMGVDHNPVVSPQWAWSTETAEFDRPAVSTLDVRIGHAKYRHELTSPASFAPQFLRFEDTKSTVRHMTHGYRGEAPTITRDNTEMMDKRREAMKSISRYDICRSLPRLNQTERYFAMRQTQSRYGGRFP